MTAEPTTLSDEALACARALAHARRLHDGRLGVRTEIARLQTEADRRAEVRDLERTWAAS